MSSSTSANATAGKKRSKSNISRASGAGGASGNARSGGSKKSNATLSPAAAAAASGRSGADLSSPNNNNKSGGGAAASDMPPSSGYLIKCDVPTKQFIQHLDDLKTVDKKFIIQNLDGYHLLVKHGAREEIDREVEKWMNDNVYSAVEKVGEDLDMS